jgi:rhomboid family protein
MVGTSDAISGVLGEYLLLYPQAWVVTVTFFSSYFRTDEVPALVVLGFWFLLQFLNALLLIGSTRGVARYFPVAGFIAGMSGRTLQTKGSSVRRKEEIT